MSKHDITRINNDRSAIGRTHRTLIRRAMTMARTRRTVLSQQDVGEMIRQTERKCSLSFFIAVQRVVIRARVTRRRVVLIDCDLLNERDKRQVHHECLMNVADEPLGRFCSSTIEFDDTHAVTSRRVDLLRSSLPAQVEQTRGASEKRKVDKTKVNCMFASERNERSNRRRYTVNNRNANSGVGEEGLYDFTY